MELTISGEVLGVVTIQPKHIVFNGRSGVLLRQAVTIVPEERFAFNILKVETKSGKDKIDYRLEPITHNGRRAFRLTVDNLQKEAGRYAETLTLTTDSKQKPQLYIHVYGNIQAPPESGSDARPQPLPPERGAVARPLRVPSGTPR